MQQRRGLSAPARAAFNHCMDLLRQRGTLETTDVELVVAYGQTIEIRDVSYQQLQKDGVVIESDRQNLSAHPPRRFTRRRSSDSRRSRPKWGSLPRRQGIARRQFRHAGSRPLVEIPSVWEKNLMTDAEKKEVFCGRRFVRLTDQKYDLWNNPEIWRGVWMANSEMLLAEWIEEHPGTRPVVWWKFSAPEERDDEEESEVEYLHRHGLLSLKRSKGSEGRQEAGRIQPRPERQRSHDKLHSSTRRRAVCNRPRALDRGGRGDPESLLGRHRLSRRIRHTRRRVLWDDFDPTERKAHDNGNSRGTTSRGGNGGKIYVEVTRVGGIVHNKIPFANGLRLFMPREDAEQFILDGHVRRLPSGTRDPAAESWRRMTHHRTCPLRKVRR